MRIAILDFVHFRVGFILRFAFTLLHPFVCFVEPVVLRMGSYAPVYLAAVMEVGERVVGKSA